MKRHLLNALCLLVVAMGANRLHATEIAPLESDYQTCMRYCMAEFGFVYCQGECKGLAT